MQQFNKNYMMSSSIEFFSVSIGPIHARKSVYSY